jgi:hypothetical protein
MEIELQGARRIAGEVHIAGNARILRALSEKRELC